MSGRKLSLVRLGRGESDVLSEDMTGLTTRPEVIKQYYGELRRLCREHNANSLTANQVGLRENFFFVSGNVRLLPSPGGTIVINPIWEPRKDSKQYASKGEECLSLPNHNGIGARQFDVPRWSNIVASWTDTSGNRVKPRALSGLVAQVFQHAHEQLRGILLTTSGIEIKPL
jgi:peptide deformylase